MSELSKSGSGGALASLWPIRNDELKKFLPLCLIMFCVLFNYTVVRTVKDVLIITAPHSGAEVVNFLKGWIVLPASILFVVLFAKLSNKLSQTGLYYASLLPFVAFFTLFATVIYPLQDFFHPASSTIESLKASYPNFQWLFPIYGVWTYAIFYTFAELWGNVGITILFWQFANEITRTEEAKRYYPLFGLFGNLALMAAGFSVRYFSQVNPSAAVTSEDPFASSLMWLMGLCTLSGIGILATRVWMDKAVLTDPRFYDGAKPAAKKKSKPKLSIGESFKYLISSRYLGYIAILVLGYGMAINMVEVTWKSQVKAAYPNPNDYAVYMGDFYWWTGVVTMTFIASTQGVVRRFGWFTGAVVTPLMIFITGVLFFSFVLFKDSLGSVIAGVGYTPLMLAVFIGALQNIFSKAAKYSLFDPTKEMAYIPLDQEMKVKGKAAVDVIGGRLGKSGGGYVQQALLLLTAGSQLTIAPYLAGVVMVVVIAWIWAVSRLSTEYNTLVAESQKNEGETA